jgi:hypothetical protein
MSILILILFLLKKAISEVINQVRYMDEARHKLSSANTGSTLRQGKRCRAASKAFNCSKIADSDTELSVLIL